MIDVIYEKVQAICDDYNDNERDIVLEIIEDVFDVTCMEGTDDPDSIVEYLSSKFQGPYLRSRLIDALETGLNIKIEK